MELIRLENVKKIYQTGEVITKAVDGIDFTVDQGEFALIIGASGAGKTTVLNILGGMDTATSGAVYIDGEDISKWNKKQLTGYRRDDIGFVFQFYNLIPNLTALENVELALQICKDPLDAKKVLEDVGLGDRLDNFPAQLSGGQKQRVALARALAVEPQILLLDEPFGALDAQVRKELRRWLRQLHEELKFTSVFVTHDQEEALTLSDTIVVMSEGRIQQIGVPTDIYNEPINSFVADFIGESNILNGVMIKDKAVTFCGHEFECVDTGFGEQMQVDVVIRPEDIYIFDVSDAAQLTGTVTSCIFKGVHYEMLVQTREGYELMVQDYHAFEAGREVGLLVKPFDIHVMKKERTCNTFEGKLVDETHVEFLGCNFECLPVQGIEPGSSVQVEVDFQYVILEDNEEDGRLTGEVKFILYKGNHYHLTVFTDWDEDIFVDTNDVWDDGDRVGITIAPQNIRIVQSLNKEGSAQ